MAWLIGKWPHVCIIYNELFCSMSLFVYIFESKHLFLVAADLPKV